MFTRYLSLALLSLGLLVSCQATPPQFQCSDAIGCVNIAPDEPLELAILQTLSGGSAPGGTEQRRAIQLVLSQRENQFLGHPIQLQIEDEHCSAEGGANAALKVIADPQAVAIFGTNCSGAGIAAGKIMSDAGLAMISSSNTSPLLTSVGGAKSQNWVPGYFRTAWNDTEMGKAAATFARSKLKISKAAVINAGDAYSRGLTDVFTQVFEQLGGKVVGEITVNEDETNLKPTLDAVALSGAEMVFFSLSHPETGSLLVKQVKETAGLENLIFIGGEGMLSDVFIRGTGADGVGVYILGPGAPSSPGNDALRAAYKIAYGEFPPSFYYSFASDAVGLLFHALEKITVQDADGTLHIGRQALRDALYATTDFNGLTGRLHCDAFGDCGVATLDIVRISQPAMSIEELRANVIYSYTSAP